MFSNEILILFFFKKKILNKQLISHFDISMLASSCDLRTIGPCTNGEFDQGFGDGVCAALQTQCRIGCCVACQRASRWPFADSGHRCAGKRKRIALCAQHVVQVARRVGRCVYNEIERSCDGRGKYSK